MSNPVNINNATNKKNPFNNNMDDSEGRKSNPSRNDMDLSESYTEISFNSNYNQNQITPTEETIDDDPRCTNYKNQRPGNLTCEKRKAIFPYNLEGTVITDGNMTHFVAQDLEYKIKISSPSTKKESSVSSTSTPPSTSGLLPRQFLIPHHLTQVDSNVLNDIEIEAQYLASSVDNLTENLCNLLHSISSITADNVETYNNAVNKLTDCMDGNIKSMYTIMAKAEEISNAMKPTEQLANRIREIKRLVDMLESV